MKNIISHQLQTQFPGQAWAFVVFQSEVYFSVLPFEQINYSQSPVTVLLQQLFDLKKDLSFFILRKPIFINYEASPKDKGMVKVVAKRLVSLNAEDLVVDEINLNYHQLKAKTSQFLSPEHFKELSFRGGSVKDLFQQLLARIPQGEVLHDRDRYVAAILVDLAGEILEFGLNSSHINKTLHAEVNLLQRFFQKSEGSFLPKGSKLYVTHKPCKMCAGMIFESMGNHLGGVEVIYLEDVRGSHSSQTILDEKGLARKLDLDPSQIVLSQ